MMKKTGALFGIAFSMVMFSACAGSAPAAVPEASDEAVSEAVSQAEEEEVSTFESSVPEELISQSLASKEELDEAVGFPILSLPEEWGYTATDFYYEPSMGTEGLASINYELDAETKSILLGSGAGDENFSLYMGDMKQSKDIEGITVKYGSSDNSFGAFWTDGTISYSIDSLGLSDDENDKLMTQLVSKTALMPGKVQSTEETEIEGMINPMVEYETYPEMEKKIDFEYLLVPESNGYTCTNIYLISNEVVQLDYVNKDDDTVTMEARTTKGNEDISGYYDMNWEESKVGDITVNKDKYEDTFVAYWSNGDFSYSLTQTGSTQEAFDSQLESAVAYTSEINVK